MATWTEAADIFDTDVGSSGIDSSTVSPLEFIRDVFDPVSVDIDADEEDYRFM